jgi:tetratricopeptide (TPR) repeat protein
MGELPFVGLEREALVERLLAAYDGVIASGSPRLVTLEAATGWGKSRIVQELYRRLAAERQRSAFWPPSILDAVAEAEQGSLESPGGRRKRVFPASFVPPHGALPEWLWWGISATARQGGAPVNALAADLEQVGRLRAPLVARLAELHPDTPWAKAVNALRSDVSREVGWEALEQSIDMVLSGVAAVVPPIGFVLLAGRYGWKNRERLKRLTGPSEPERLTQGVEQEDVRGEMVRDTVEKLGRFAADGIPVILVLEDVHQADETLIDLLVKVLENRHGPVLIVATAWPGTLEDEGRQAHRLLSDAPAPAVERIRAAELAGLTLEERVGLVGALLPTTDGVARRMLARKWVNPLALELGCRLQAVEQLLEDGELTDEELAGLPVDVDGLYRTMWSELPKDLRQALMLAVLATPATVSGRLFDDRRWDVDLPAAAAVGIDWLAQQAAGLRTRLVEDATGYDWVRHVDEWLQTCHEPAHFQVAVDAALDSGAFSATRRRAYYQALADAIGSDDDLEGSEERRQAQARLLVSLAFEGFIDWSDSVILAAHRLIVELLSSWDTASLRTITVLADALPASVGEAELARRRSAAIAYGLLGQFGTAIDRMQSLLDGRLQAFGADDVDGWQDRGYLASLHGISGRPDKAVEQLSALLESDTVLAQVPSHEGTLSVRGDLAYWLWMSGRVQEAVEHFSRLLEDQVRALRAEDTRIFTTRGHLASLLGECGRPEAAVEQLTLLLEDQVRVLGDDHWETMSTRGKLAHWLGMAGRTDEAVERLTELVADEEQMFSGSHRHALETRGKLAHWLGMAGRAEEAIEQFERLLDIQVREFGVDHTDTMVTRNNYAFLLGNSQRTEDAIEQFEQLLEDRTRVLTADHRQTLDTRLNLAYLIGVSGNLEEAVTRLTELAEHRSRALSSDELDTLATRGHLAVFLARSGRLEAATEQFDLLLKDRLRVFGPEHPETLSTRFDRAFWLGMSGGVRGMVESQALLLALHEDCRQHLGEDHEVTRAVATALGLRSEP